VLNLVNAYSPRQTGKSLIELMVATTVGCIVLGSVAQLMLAGQRSATTQADKQMLHHALYRTLDYLKRDIKRAGFNDAESMALQLLGADSVLELQVTSDPNFNFSQLEYVYKIDANHYEHVEISNNPSANTMSICRKTTTYLPEKSSCPARFSLLDKQQIHVTTFNITSIPMVTSGASASLLEIELGLRSLATSNSITDSIFVAQRNSQ
jgi:type IV pilus assembly protein PilW